MSATFTTGQTHRFLAATTADAAATTRACDAGCAVSSTSYVLAAWNPDVGAHQLALYSSSGTLIATHTWASYVITAAAADEFRLRAVGSGTFAVFHARRHADSGTNGPDASVHLVSWSSDAPTIGTPWTYNAPNFTASPWNTSDYRLLDASPSRVLLWEHRLTDGATNNTGRYQTLDISGLALTAGATANPGAGLARDDSVRLATWVDTGYFVVATGGAETSTKKLELLTTGVGSISVASDTSVTESTASSTWTTGASAGPGFGLADGSSDWLVTFTRSGSSLSYQATAVSVQGTSYGPGSAAVKTDTDYAYLLQGTDVVTDAADTPVDYTDAGDLFGVLVKAGTTSSPAQLAVRANRSFGRFSSSMLSSNLGLLAWAEGDALTGTDTLVRTQMVQTSSDTTVVDDVGSIITNYFGGVILQRYLLDQPSYLGLFTADPTVLGTLSGEVAGGDYARLLASWSSPGSKTVSLAAALRFLNMPACTVTHLGVLDAVTGGHLLVCKALPVAIPVVSSAEFRVPANSVAVQF